MFQVMVKPRAAGAHPGEDRAERALPRQKTSLEEIALDTARLTLRSFAPWDATEIAAPITPTLHRFINWDAWPSREGFTGIWHDWLTMMEQGEAVALVLRRRDAGAGIVGMAGLHFVRPDEPLVGIWIRDSLQGLGFGTEAMEALADWAFRERAAKALYFPVFNADEPSRRIVAKLGGTPSSGDIQDRSMIFRGPSPALYRIPRPIEARGTA